MKTILFITLLFLNTQNNICYVQKFDEPILYLYVDKLPQLNDDGDLNKYVYSNLKWPNQFGGQGTVLISFVVQKNGDIINVKIEKSLCPFCDEEVVRVFQSMPNWEPGEVNSVQVDVKMYFPVEFKIGCPR